MGAVLYKNEDPRDNLGKATRDELWAFTKSSGIMPAMLEYLKGVYWHPQKGWTPRNPGEVADQSTITKPDMENFLRGRGCNNISVAIRSMGRPTGEYLGPKPTLVQPTPAPAAPNADPPADIDKMSIGELRTECKARGIKMSRRDNMEAIRQKLRENRS